MRLGFEDVKRAKFREKFRGYAPAEVDAALDRIATHLASGRRLRRSELDALEFSPAWRGYHPDDVDALIAQLREDAL